jgi:membrane protease YdiL (CAAX protease family)
VAIVLLTSVLFAFAHYPGQGLAGAEQALITGIVIGTIFVLTGSLWLPIVVHAAFDVAAVLIIYWNFESRLAHLLFP